MAGVRRHQNQDCRMASRNTGFAGRGSNMGPGWIGSPAVEPDHLAEAAHHPANWARAVGRFARQNWASWQHHLGFAVVTGGRT